MATADERLDRLEHLVSDLMASQRALVVRAEATEAEVRQVIRRSERTTDEIKGMIGALDQKLRDADQRARDAATNQRKTMAMVAVAVMSPIVAEIVSNVFA